MLDEVFQETGERMDKTLRLLADDFAGLRTGRASPGLVKNIQVDYYGSPTPLQQLATISIPESRQILIKPFDVNSVKDIEKAIMTSDLGVMPQVDGKFIRLNLPPLTDERRRDLGKIARRKGEETKIALRNIRRDANDMIDDLEDEKEISEDAAHRGKNEIQEMINEHEKRVNVLVEKKETEILES